MNHTDPCTRSDGRVVVVLGAGQGIGASVAAAAVASGRRVVLVARTAEKLDATRSLIDPAGADTVTCPCDITAPRAADVIAERALGAFGTTPAIIVQSAGFFLAGPLDSTPDDEVVDLFMTNALSPLRVIRALVDRSDDPGRHVVVVNSSAGLALNQASAAFSASQIALRALTDALRASVNDLGVRVTSIFSGRTDTPRMRCIVAAEGGNYDPAVLLRPDDVARAVLTAIDVSDRAEITEIVIRPMRK